MIAKRTVLLGVSSIVALMIALHFMGWIRPIEVFFRSLINPASGTLYRASVALSRTTSTNGGTQCSEAISSCIVDKAELIRLREENAELRAELRFLNQNSYISVGAEVIGRNIDPIGTTLIINQGMKAGIAKNNPVIAGGGHLIGKIARADEDTAIVRLLNDNASRVAATMQNRDRSVGLVEGGYGLSIRMNFIPQNEVVNQGDVVVTSGLEEGIPRGLVIGTVEVVEKTPQGPFQEAVLSPAIDFDNLALVSVIVR